MIFETWLKLEHPDIPFRSAQAVLALHQEGSTIPFIARYRKEATGNLDEVAIAQVIDSKERFDAIQERQAFIVGEIEKQGKLTPELKASIESTFDKQKLEDLYLPYKQKKKSKAGKAREAGLEPLANWIWDCGHGVIKPEPGQTLELWALTFRNDAFGYTDAATCIDGACDILIERLSENPALRERTRQTLFNEAGLSTEKSDKAKPNSKFEPYFDYREKVTSLLKPENSHRYLAIRRGWIEEELKLKIEADESTLLAPFLSEACTIELADEPAKETAAIVEALRRCARQALKAHVQPSLENEVHAALKSVADEVAIHVFSENARKLLLASPFGPKAVLGVDPGVRTGCKCAWIDASGRYLASFVMQLQTDEGKAKAKEHLKQLLSVQPVSCFAVGNGTAGRETEIFLRQALKELGSEIPVVMVNEAGASVYSASEVAREEFPDLDVTVRGAISIARRLQDPLAELVKIDPKSIGVGQYQHDVNQPALKRSLDRVVDSCVNSVGVNVNTASEHLLARVSGIGEGLAKSIVQHRGSKGLFRSRQAIMDVPRFSQKTFEQAAGFLRVPESDHPLDRTGVHPEKYSLLEEFARSIGKQVSDLVGNGVALVRENRELREKLGEFTFADVLAELEKPGRDPRQEFVPFQFRSDIHELKDLQAGMLCPGIVTNVTNFGAFVDIGVHQDGLVHISQLAQAFVKDPKQVVSPGDRVQVKVLEVNLEKRQISLTMKLGEKAEQPARETREKGARREKHPPREKRPREPLPPPNSSAKIMPRAISESKPRSTAKIDASKPARAGKSPIKPQPAFNNPFASALANLKKNSE